MKRKKRYKGFGLFDRLDDTSFSKFKIKVYDVDDTLVLTESKIKVHDTRLDERYELSPEEFNTYQRKPHHDLDFSDFEDIDILKGGRIIEWVFKTLRSAHENKTAVGIITARNNKQLIFEFLNHHNVIIHPELIFAVNDPETGFTGTTDEKKMQAMEQIVAYGYSNVEFFDDDHANLAIMEEVERNYPGVRIKTHHIKKD